MHGARMVLLLPIVMGMSGCVSWQPAPPDTQLRVQTDFPGGSAKVEAIDQQTRIIRITPAHHADRGWDCWWHFKLSGIEPGETISLQVRGMNFALGDRAFYSMDGRKWSQTPAGIREPGAVTFRQAIPGREAWFAWGPPFSLSDARSLARMAAWQNREATVFTLTRSAEGKLVPALHVGTGNPAKPVLWVQARQHAWESGSSWVCKGFVDWLTSRDAEAESLRRLAEIYVVPIMDVDNVERGAGGKGQKPQDHNRDWSASPHWPEVRAAQERLLEFGSAGRLALFVDLHNPAPNDRQPFFFIPPDEIIGERSRKAYDVFLTSTRETMTGPLTLTASPRVSGSNYDPNWERISKNWVQKHCGDGVVSVTLETSWNTPDSDAGGYERVGRELGRGIERFFRRRDR